MGSACMGWIRSCLLIFKKRHFSFYDESKQIWSENKCVIFCLKLNLDQRGGGGGGWCYSSESTRDGNIEIQRRRAYNIQIQKWK